MREIVRERERDWPKIALLSPLVFGLPDFAGINNTEECRCRFPFIEFVLINCGAQIMPKIELHRNLVANKPLSSIHALQRPILSSYVCETQ